MDKNHTSSESADNVTEAEAHSMALADILPKFELQGNRGSCTPMGGAYAVAFVALSTIIMAYSFVLGAASILVFYGLWLPQIPYRGLRLLQPSKTMLLCFLLPLLACISVLWSDYPMATLRAGLQFMSMMLCTLIIARIVRLEHFLMGVSLGGMLVLLLTLANGTYGYDRMSNSYSLVGLFGSKNQVGLMAEVTLIAAGILLFMPGKRLYKLLYALAPFIIAALCLKMSHSASAMLSSAAVAAVGIAAYGIMRMPAKSRKFVFFLVIICAGGFAAAFLFTDLYAAILHAFDKDTTLTGRTYLWEQGMHQGMNDLVGVGYAGFWVHGRLLAEMYWDEFYITSRTGFHFHNLFIQTLVDLGLAGLLLMVLILLFSLFQALGRVLNPVRQAESVLYIAVATMFIIRAFVEVDILGPYGMGILFYFYILLKPKSRVLHD
ncbi:MAG: O-antigen ligase family protein [Alphaproteobacteria bacterium]|nr:O-antigen ligase family protein [Alphaproteobacteria bacterium]